MRRHKPREVVAPDDVPLRLWRDPVAAGIILVAAVLIFVSLGQRCLWQDEAETALLARNVLTFGKPVAFDGVNLVSQEAGRDIGPDFVWRWSPWGQIYLAAASMRILGLTTFAARLPFAVCGVLAVMATYVAAARLFASAWIARISAAALAVSVPFLLHVRQARWHAPVYLLVALLLIALRPGVNLTLFIVTGTSLFYINYFVAICVFISIAVAAPLLSRERAFLLRLAVALAAVALLSLPGAVYFHILERGQSSGAGQSAAQLRGYFGSLLTYLLPLPALAAAVWLAFRDRATRFLLAFVSVYIVVISFAPWEMFRYLTTVFPATAMLIAAPLAVLVRRGRTPGAIAVIVAVTVTIVYQGRWFPLVAYGSEITAGVRDADCIICDYLRAHARAGETIIATYGDLPIAFYTPLRVAGGLQGQPLPPNPDWMLLRGFIAAADPMKDARVAAYIRHIYDPSRYAIVLPLPDPPLGNTPDPRFHRFAGDPAAGKGYLIRRRQ